MRVLTPAESAFFLQFLSALDNAKIPHAIARNHEGFPHEIGNDVDLLIPRRECANARLIFLSEIAKAGGTVWQENPRDYVLDLRFSLPDSPAPLHLDLYWGVFTWHGLPYVDEKAALSQSRTANGFRTVRPAHEAMGLFFASLLWGSFYKEKYGPKISAILSDNEERQEFERCVKRAFGPAPLPFEADIESAPSSEIAASTGKTLRFRLKCVAFGRKPLTTLAALARHWIREIRAAMRPAGLSVAIFGPDGSGKSTVIKLLAEKLGPVFVRVQSHHFRPRIFPEPGVALGRREYSDGPEPNPHGKIPHGSFISLARLAWYWVDFWVGHLLVTRRGMGVSELLLFDRYAADFLCDPRRYRMGLPKWILRILVATFPRPTLTFVLNTDAKTLAIRKGELDFDAATLLISNYKSLEGSGATVVNASSTPNEVANSITKLIMEYLRRRTQIRGQ